MERAVATEPLSYSPPFPLEPPSNSTIYHRSLTVVSHRGYDFSNELEVNPTSPMSSPCHTLAPELYRSEIAGL
jgi:hypothetical protein